MSILTAQYDIATDKIIGCKEKSTEWWHERGHQILHNNVNWKSVELYNQYLFIYVIALLIVNNRFLAGIFFAIYLTVPIIDELYAWAYCFKHKSEWIK